MKYFLFVLCFVFLSVAEDSIPNNIHFKIAHSVNFRDPKDDKNKIDWWVGGKSTLSLDSLLGLTFYIKASTEKDNGIRYYQHTEKISFKYGYAQYYKDTEDKIELLNITGYYVIFDIIKIGADFSWDHWKRKYGLYAAVDWNWLFVEISYFREINRIRASIEPTMSFGKKKLLSFGLDCEVNYVDKLIDWKAGYSIQFKIDTRKKDEEDN